MFPVVRLGITILVHAVVGGLWNVGIPKGVAYVLCKQMSSCHKRQLRSYSLHKLGSQLSIGN